MVHSELSYSCLSAISWEEEEICRNRFKIKGKKKTQPKNQNQASLAAEASVSFLAVIKRRKRGEEKRH